jgi:hypothetical protein
MIKTLTITLLLFFTIITHATESVYFTKKNADVRSDNSGCLLGDKLYPVGYREQMNHKELARYKKETGYTASDGYAVMMQCIYIVNPNSDDHPEVSDRSYIWVAS